MDRRESLKSLLIGTIAGATLGASACTPEEKTTGPDIEQAPLYGRLPEEIERDKQLMSEVFLNEHELTTVAVLCDIILPATSTAGSANDAEVPAFIEFIVKDLPSHQLPMRGGLMWMDSESNKRFNKLFKDATDAQQIEIVDDIAYPDPDGKKPEMAYGIKFFNLMRNLTLTGYYTSKIGIEDLGYMGNRPNVWDGVPQDILDKHGMAYEEELLPKYVDQSKRMDIAEWDDQGNLLT
ncbi:MAG: gluconate 2-dehydrogenase subunit 3 family protein [Bacteroidota bacterium]